MSINHKDDDNKQNTLRHERLKFTYDKLTLLLINEANLISSRTYNFLTFNSILFAGYLLLNNQPSTNCYQTKLIINIVLPVSGIIFSLFHSASIIRTIESADYWRSSIGLIEDDPDFWNAIKSDYDIDLDIFRAKRRYTDGIKTRQNDYILRNKGTKIPRFVQKVLSYLPTPDHINVYLTPAMTIIMWLTGLAWATLR